MTGRFWYEFPVTYLDFETSGIDVDSFVVSCCLGDLDRDEFAGDPAPRVWLAKPPVGRLIPESATAVHGISTEQAQRDGTDYGRVVAEIVDAVNAAASAGRAIAAYNLSFDWSLLTREAYRLGLTLATPELLIDPLVIDRAVSPHRTVEAISMRGNPYAKKAPRALTDVCELFGITMRGDAHDARVDAVAAGELARRMQDLVASCTEGSPVPVLRYLSGLDAVSMVRWQAEQRHEQQLERLAEQIAGGHGDDVEFGWPVLDAVAERVAA